MTIQWWRSWHGAPIDPKWQVIAVRSGVKVGIVSAVAWALMDYASQQEERGSVKGFDTEMYAVYSGFDEAEIIAVIKSMTDKGVIVDGKLTAWEKRQPKREDDSADRVRNWRALKRNVTQCNAPDKEEDKEKEEEEGASPADLPNERALDPGTLITKIYHGVTGFIALPSGEDDKADKIYQFWRDKKTINGAVEYLKPFYLDWCTRKTKTGKAYSKLGMGWLDWAMAGETPEQGRSNGGYRPRIEGV